ncbi:MAG TPA: hypothetical protein VMM18_07500 [Gemmatimonadaceae bacterium]|nr:hypothetical protein [Gemmatimonadaceae bacterium]
MSAALTLVLIVAVAYLATHLAFDWIARRLLIVSGAEYLVLGILLGPQVSGILTGDTLDSFAPFTTLALGWIGAIVGMQFFLPNLVRIRGIVFRLAFVEAILTLTFVGGLLTVAMAWMLDMSYVQAAFPGLAMGAIATVSAPTGIQVVASRIGRRHPVVHQLEVTSALDAAVAIAAIGILLCIGHPSPIGIARPLTSTEWAVVTLGIGVIGGVLFHLFLGEERDIDRLFISLAGAIILTSGAAAYLSLSPLLPALIVGAVLVNTSDNREEIERTLLTAERPFYFVLLIFAGATWEPSLRSWALPVLLFLAARGVGKIGGARLATRFSDEKEALGLDWGRALLGQGGLAIAIGLDYLQHGRLAVPNLVFTAAVASVLLTDLSSARLVRSVVMPFVTRDMGPEIARTLAEPGRKEADAPATDGDVASPDPSPDPTLEATTGAAPDDATGGNR